ncbi:MAG: nuclear transport factor 2 family protein [Hyphomicrobium sp.]
MLNPSPEFVVRAYFDAWINQDLDRALSYISADAPWRMHIDTEIITFAGLTVGREAMRQRMLDLLAIYELLTYEVDFIEFVGQQARTLSRGDYRHRPSGHVLDLVIRHVFRVEGKLIVEIDEYHDADRIRAFVAMAEQSGAHRPPLARHDE